MGRLALVVACAIVFASVALLVREVKRVPPRPTGRAAPTMSLTDVAGPSARGPAPSLPVFPGYGEPPEYDVAEDGQSMAKPAPYVLPEDLPDPANPPRGTEPLALPGEPIPPDPLVEPPIEQDPHRGGRTE